MPERAHRVLFLCTGNSARSILAEAILNRIGGGRLVAYSAGSRPTGRVHPLALELLEQRGVDTSGLRSKSWDEFAGSHADPVDLVVTVCDAAAGETCPVWPGHPLTAHWGVEDPAACSGPEQARRRAFQRAYRVLERRISRLVRLPVGSPDRGALKARLDEIGRDDGGAAGPPGGEGG